MSSTDEILLERHNGLGIVTLNRPKALNTLSLGMYRTLDPKLVEWGEDPGVRAIVIRGAGDKAFCAGGDVRAIYEARQHPRGASGDYKADFFREEYWLIERVHRFPKPYIALMDGIAMGGGMGVSVNGWRRVVTERTLCAMPEVQIGLFPDVGATRYLNLCPGRIGMYLALTGARTKAADALYCGFGTHYVPHAQIAALTEALGAIAWRAGEERAQVDAVLERFQRDPGPAPLAALRAAIDRCFGGASVAEIVDALAKEGTDWGRETRAIIERASPISVHVTFRQMKLGEPGMDIEAALALEYRMTQHMMAAHDFFEGIRAVLVEKDLKPRWEHAALAEVGEAEVERYFEKLGERELVFE
ncbi:MAG TPA: enoyl-CoA hydratase/isomerase family protein [Stellaceae bacterium]|nr:enoyl-CoA hydratase/isomerase family protein [Stellaceae bacterium]